MHLRELWSPGASLRGIATDRPFPPSCCLLSKSFERIWKVGDKVRPGTISELPLLYHHSLRLIKLVYQELNVESASGVNYQPLNLILASQTTNSYWLERVNRIVEKLVHFSWTHEIWPSWGSKSLTLHWTVGRVSGHTDVTAGFVPIPGAVWCPKWRKSAILPTVSEEHP